MKKILFPLSLLLVSGAAQAIDSEDLRLSGFMSLVGGYSSSKIMPYNTQPRFANSNYDDSFSAGVDTRIGAQLDVKLSDRFSATVQALSHSSNDYDPEASLAFISYKVNDEITLRAGRIGLPLYTYSDYYDIGYAYPWITPPRLAYFLPISRSNGVDVLYNVSTGSIDHSVQAYFMDSNEKAYAPDSTEITLNVDNTIGIVYIATIDNLSLRAAYHTAELETRVSSTSQDEEPYFMSFGGKYEFGRYYLNAEYNVLKHRKETTPDTTGWYATFGAYVNDDTQLYTTYESSTDTFTGTKDADKQAINTGVRWDLAPNMALKAQYTRYNDDTLDESSNVYRIALDTVF